MGPKAVALEAAAEERSLEVRYIGLAWVIATVCHMSDGSARIASGLEAVRWAVKDLGVGRSFAARIGFVLEVVISAGAVRSSERSAEIVFAWQALKVVGKDLVEDSSQDCNHFELEVVGYAFVQCECHLAATEAAVEGDTVTHFVKHKLGDSIEQNFGYLVVVRWELDIDQQSL